MPAAAFGELLAGGVHQPSTVMPMERAVPAIMFIASRDRWR